MVGCSNKITLPASLIDFNRSGQLTTDGNMEGLKWHLMSEVMIFR